MPQTSSHHNRPTTYLALLQLLEQHQQAQGLSDRAFAARLGISNGHWSHIRAGTGRMGPKTLRAISRLFPDLAPYVLAYLCAPSSED